MAHILLVEDFAVIRRLIEVAIAPLDHTLVMAPTGEAALQELDSQHFDLIMLDIGLPGISGWDFLRALQERNEATSQTPVLVVTAHGDRSDEDLAYELGARAFIAKPFLPDDLMAAVDEIVGAGGA